MAEEKKNSKLVNFRLTPEEYDGLRILSELTSKTQTDIVRDLIRSELQKQEAAIAAYKKSIDTIKATIMK